MARVEGFEPAHSGQAPVDVNGNPVAVGVWGDSSTGIGVFGTSGTLPTGVDNIPANIAGVEGHSVENPGVFGRSIEDAGVQGESLQGLGMLGRSLNGSGVLGVTFTPSVPGEPPAAHGVFGVSTAGGNGVVGFVGDATGVVGNSVRGNGVHGITGAGHGVLGESFGGGEGRGASGAGVFGRSDSGIGVRASSSSNSGAASVTFGDGDGLAALHFSTGPGSGVSGMSVLNVGVDGFSFSDFGVRGQGRRGGVQGICTSNDPNAGAIVGQNLSGFAGIFLGKVRVTGFLSKAGGGFEIDHPLDPANKYLRHSFVECPDMLNVYSGNVTTDDDGEARVMLPDYFEALNRDFRYQLTVIGQFAQAMVAQEVRNNQFAIKTDQPRVKVSWQVTGVRQDAWAVANRMAVEGEKSAEDKGRYLHPQLWADTEQAAIHRHAPPEDQHRLGEQQQRRLGQLLPESIGPQVERQLRALLGGEHEDPAALRSLFDEARRLAAPQDRARLDAEWRQVEALVQRVGGSSAGQAEAARSRLRRLGQLVPEPARRRLDEQLQALLRGERADREELGRLVAEARRSAAGYLPEESGKIGRAGLEAEWRRVEALVQNMPRMSAEAPQPGRPKAAREPNSEGSKGGPES
jgi:hypothetical protein